jgi:hypothetical protein
MICHNGHTIAINASALPGHLRSGDTVGPCQEVAGETAARKRDPAQPAISTTKGSLAGTGFSLGASALTSLLLVAIGLALRRRTDSSNNPT